MKSLSFRFILLLPAFFVAAPLAATVQDDLVLQAMRDELARSTTQLQFENLDKPYFVSCRMQEGSSQGVSATFGSTLGRSESRRRSLTVEVRVGSPALDNSNFQSGYGSMSALLASLSAEAPLDDSYTELRRQLWLATDRAYKQAVENLSRKKAALQNKTRTDETPDFSPQEPFTITDRQPGKPLDLDQAEALVRELSAVFRETPAVATSHVRLGAGDELVRYVNSEGSSFVRQSYSVSLSALAATQAADGFPLEDHFLIFCRSWEELPAKAELLGALRELGTRLATLSNAPLLDQYNGPVLFEGQAATEIFSQVFAPELSARKRPVSDSGSSGAFENPFVDKLGARVIADFLSITDDPTLTKLGSVPLLGDGRVDDEGVPTRPVKLVEKGRLKTLLVSRSPVRGVPRSTGSMHGTGPVPGNLIVTASEGLEPAALKAELLKLVQQRGREYGVIIRRLGNPWLRSDRLMTLTSSRESVRVEPAILAYKIFPDGREELLRNVEIAGMNTQSFKDILAAGREPMVSTLPYRAPTSSGSFMVSFAVPSLLFEDVTLKKPIGEIPKPQVVKHPYFSK